MQKMPPWPKKRKVLDVGCGPGKHIDGLCKNRLDVYGIDLSLELLKIAQKKVPAAKLIQMNMCELGFPDIKFDGLWAYASLHHLPKELQGKALQEFRRVLRPGGYAFIAVKEGEGELFKSIDIMNGEKRFFSYSLVERFIPSIEKAGFMVIEWTRQQWKPHEKWIKVLAQRPG